jgi:hypothetical protein
MKFKFSLLLLLVFISHFSYAMEKGDTLKPKLNAGVTFSLNSNGIASIPAFSLGKPAMMASAYFVKGRFSYEPLLAYGLDGKPWFIDNWLHYKPVVRLKYELRVGFNLSTFCSKHELPEGSIHEAQRYFAFELTQTYKFTSRSFLSLAYWNDRGQEPGAISGHFISLTGERNEIPVGKNVLLAANIMLFYINYTGNNDGLFISPKVSSTVRNLPFDLFFQATQTIQTNVEPYPEFKWNIGISYTL